MDQTSNRLSRLAPVGSTCSKYFGYDFGGSHVWEVVENLMLWRELQQFFNIENAMAKRYTVRCGYLFEWVACLQRKCNDATTFFQQKVTNTICSRMLKRFRNLIGLGKFLMKLGEWIVELAAHDSQLLASIFESVIYRKSATNRDDISALTFLYLD